MSRVVATAVAAVALLAGACANSPPDIPEESEPTTAVSTTSSTAPLDLDEREVAGARDATPPPAPPAAKSPVCRPGNPLANVHHASRLQVITPCVVVVGTVRSVRNASDGNVRIDLEPDQPFQNLLNAVNISQNFRWLVVEIVPADQPGCIRGQPPRPPVGDYDFGLCTGAGLSAPSPGSHVEVVGPYVQDTRKGWMEIHPAWGIRQFTTVLTTAPPPTTAFRLPPTSPTTTFTAPVPTSYVPPPTTSMFGQ